MTTPALLQIRKLQRKTEKLTVVEKALSQSEEERNLLMQKVAQLEKKVLMLSSQGSVTTVIHGTDIQISDPRPKPPQAPELPPAARTPWMTIENAALSNELGTIYTRARETSAVTVATGCDVEFQVGERTCRAHSMILVSACPYLEQLLRTSMTYGAAKEVSTTHSNQTAWVYNRIVPLARAAVFKRIQRVERVEPGVTPQAVPSDISSVHPSTQWLVTLCDDIDIAHFEYLVEFWYRGQATLSADSDPDVLSGVMKVATVFDSELVDFCQNILDGNDFLNPSLETWLTDRTAERLNKLYFSRTIGATTGADMSFSVEGKLIPAHSYVLRERSTVLKAMLDGKFREAQAGTAATRIVSMQDVSLEVFMPFLEYLYTDHAPIEECEDMVGLMMLADQYNLPRLVNLTELYISKEIEKETRDEITQAEIDVIGLLDAAQLSNAKQLEEFCLHFMSVNYEPFSKREDFSSLQGDNLKHVVEHQYPPLSYWDQMAQYERDVEEYKEKLREWEGEDSESTVGVSGTGNSKSKRKSFRLKKGKSHKRGEQPPPPPRPDAPPQAPTESTGNLSDSDSLFDDTDMSTVADADAGGDDDGGEGAVNTTAKHHRRKSSFVSRLFSFGRHTVSRSESATADAAVTGSTATAHADAHNGNVNAIGVANDNHGDHSNDNVGVSVSVSDSGDSDTVGSQDAKETHGSASATPDTPSTDSATDGNRGDAASEDRVIADSDNASPQFHSLRSESIVLVEADTDSDTDNVDGDGERKGGDAEGSDPDADDFELIESPSTALLVGMENTLAPNDSGVSNATSTHTRDVNMTVSVSVPMSAT
eukprot:GFYU01002459.1.p1 GENE.GFYU01002459.1~~GFYU01002459.1.p1  ORF type:complete len:823 (-),score=207.42 GFYU01002459.1:385-2853(-)